MDNERHAHLSEEVRDELDSLARAMNAPQLAERVWEKFLSEEERKRLGDDLEEAWKRTREMKGMTERDKARLPRGTPSIWMRARGVSWEVAVIEIAFKLKLLLPQCRARLLGEIGVSEDASERMVNAAIVSGALVLRDDLREASWRNEPIEMDWWNADNAQWLFFWKLCRCSKRGKWLTHDELGGKMTKSALSTQRDRLVNHEKFPPDLCCKVESRRNGGYRIELGRNEIRMFVEEDGILRELT